MKQRAIFFPVGVFFHQTLAIHKIKGEGSDHLLFHSATSTHQHLDIYLQLCLWDDYHVYFISPLEFARLLLDEIYHTIELLLIDWWCRVIFLSVLFDNLILGLCYNNLTRETGGFELLSYSYHPCITLNVLSDDFSEFLCCSVSDFFFSNLVNSQKFFCRTSFIFLLPDSWHLRVF